MRSRIFLAPVLGLALAAGPAACGGGGGVTADSVADKIEDQSVYDVSGCSETTDQDKGGRSFTCQSTTVAGGVSAPGEEATIIVTEADEGLTATVATGGQIVDFFTLD